MKNYVTIKNPVTLRSTRGDFTTSVDMVPRVGDVIWISDCKIDGDDYGAHVVTKVEHLVCLDDDAKYRKIGFNPATQMGIMVTLIEKNGLEYPDF